MPIFKLLAFIFALFGGAAAGAVWLLSSILIVPVDPPELEPEIVHAYGVQSPCGYFGVVVIYSDGDHILYDQNPVPNEINKIPPENRTTIIVPCPPPFLQPLDLKV